MSVQEYRILDQAHLKMIALSNHASFLVDGRHLLAQIENTPLSKSYFADLLLAMQNTLLFDTTAICIFPKAKGVEIIGDVADLLIRCETVEQVLCGSQFGSDLCLSARTSQFGGNATALLRSTIGDLGSAGGHQHRAEGKIRIGTDQPELSDEWLQELRKRWLTVVGVDRRKGKRLVTRKDVLKNL